MNGICVEDFDVKYEETGEYPYRWVEEWPPKMKEVLPAKEPESWSGDW